VRSEVLTTVLGHDGMYDGRSSQTFRIKVLPPFSGSKNKARKEEATRIKFGKLQYTYNIEDSHPVIS
jgi:hypothetical protein